MDATNYRSMLSKAKELRSHLVRVFYNLTEADDPLEAQLFFWDAAERMEELRSLVDVEVARKLKARIAAGIQMQELRGLAYILSLGDECGCTKACSLVRAEIARAEKRG
jgi:hypothetical protein